MNTSCCRRLSFSSMIFLLFWGPGDSQKELQRLHYLEFKNSYQWNKAKDFAWNTKKFGAG